MIFRADVGNLFNLKWDEADARFVVRWIRILAQSLDLLVAWALVWFVAHLTMVAVGAIFVGPNHGAIAFILIPVEVVPGTLVVLMALRLAVAMTMTIRIIPAVGDVRGTGRPPPAWTQRPGLQVRLSTPTDFDFAVVLLLAVALLYLMR
jgi:hypothetical protein